MLAAQLWGPGFRSQPACKSWAQRHTSVTPTLRMGEVSESLEPISLPVLAGLENSEIKLEALSKRWGGDRPLSLEEVCERQLVPVADDVRWFWCSASFFTEWAGSIETFCSFGYVYFSIHVRFCSVCFLSCILKLLGKQPWSNFASCCFATFCLSLSHVQFFFFLNYVKHCSDSCPFFLNTWVYFLRMRTLVYIIVGHKD